MDGSSQWEKSNEVYPIAHLACSQNRKQILDGLSNKQGVACDDHPGISSPAAIR